MLHVTDRLSIPVQEIEILALRAQGPGGQNVNKVSTVVQLRFDVHASSLPEHIKARLLARRDQRITKDSVVLIKAQQHRSQEQNRDDALTPLQELVRSAAIVPKKRKPSRPTRGSKTRRLDAKRKRGFIKALRGRVNDQPTAKKPLSPNQAKEGRRPVGAASPSRHGKNRRKGE